MAFDFTPSKYTDAKGPMTTTSGNTPLAWRMFGDAGAAAPGKSKWLDLHGVMWKSWILRMANSPHNGALGAASVEIHVANELDPVDADANTKFRVLATLNTGAPAFDYEPPYRYVRAELKVAGAAAVQVDFYGIGC